MKEFRSSRAYHEAVLGILESGADRLYQRRLGRPADFQHINPSFLHDFSLLHLSVKHHHRSPKPVRERLNHPDSCIGPNRHVRAGRRPKPSSAQRQHGSWREWKWHGYVVAASSSWHSGAFSTFDRPSTTPEWCYVSAKLESDSKSCRVCLVDVVACTKLFLPCISPEVRLLRAVGISFLGPA